MIFGTVLAIKIIGKNVNSIACIATYTIDSKKTIIQGGPKVGLHLVGVHFTLKKTHFITFICIFYNHICSILFMYIYLTL